MVWRDNLVYVSSACFNEEGGNHGCIQTEVSNQGTAHGFARPSACQYSRHQGYTCEACRACRRMIGLTEVDHWVNWEMTKSP